VFDAVSDNNISQGFFKLLSPLIKSPLLPLGIAGLYSFPFRADAEVKQYEAVKKMMDEQEAALKKVAADFKKDSTAGQMKRLRTFAEDKFDSDLITNFNLCLAQFIAKASKEELAIFDDVKFDVKEEKDDKKEVTVKRTFAELREKGGLSTDPLAILNSILKMADKQKLEDPFLLFTAVEKPERTTGQNLDEFTKAGQNQKKSKELIAAQRKALDQNFVFDRAKKYGFSSPETDKDKRYEAFKKQIIERDFNFVRSMAEYDTPSTEVHKPTGSPMYGDSKQITSKL
jgi:hypothetical protein